MSDEILKIDSNNYHTFEPDELAGLIHDGKAVLIEMALSEVFKIIGHIVQGVKERKRLRTRVDRLEAIMLEQAKTNDRILLLLGSYNLLNNND